MTPKEGYRTNTLASAERLKRKKEIQMLFQNGKAFSYYPIRIIFRFIKTPLLTDNSYSPVKIGFSIPKRRVRQAHKRNRHKRLLKEAWRTQKQPLYKVMPPGQQLHCFLIFKDSKMLTFEDSKAVTNRIIGRLVRECRQIC